MPRGLVSLVSIWGKYSYCLKVFKGDRPSEWVTHFGGLFFISFLYVVDVRIHKWAGILTRSREHWWGADNGCRDTLPPGEEHLTGILSNRSPYPDCRAGKAKSRKWIWKIQKYTR